MSKTKAKSKAKRGGKQAKAKSHKGRLGPGELDGLVLAYMRKRKDDGPLTPSAIGKGIERSSGAVANCLVRLAKAKKVRQAKRKPRGYVMGVEMSERASRGAGGQAPHSLPPLINHVILTGRLAADPEEGRNPSGEPITLLRVEFPVMDPDRPRSLWRCAASLVEVPAGRAAKDIEELRGGSPLLTSGQISNRWMIDGGHTSRCGVIVASMVKAGPPEAAPAGIHL